MERIFAARGPPAGIVNREISAMASTLFYSIAEASKKLGKSADEIQRMISSGQLQEFKDSDGQLVVKREAVDMIAEDAIPLAMDDDRESISLADDSRSGSGSASGIGSNKERSGISIFEGDEEQVDASAQTLITQAPTGATNPGTGDASGSGSGLDMTRNDDTSLGGGLLDDVYNNDQGSDNDVVRSLGDSRAGNDGLFENSGVASDVGGGMTTAGLIEAEQYDAAWSGIGGGLAFATVIISAALLAVVILGTMNAGSGLINLFADNLWAFVGGFAGLAIFAAIVGFVLGKKS